LKSGSCAACDSASTASACEFHPARHTHDQERHAIKQATGWSGCDTGPESGAPGEKFVAVHVVRPVTGKGQAYHTVENINGGRASGCASLLSSQASAGQFGFSHRYMALYSAYSAEIWRYILRTQYVREKKSLREFCGDQLCIVMHRGARCATGVTVSY
jgi:hypothetical protein